MKGALLRKKFCPSCGKTIEKGAFCKDCTTRDFEFKDIKIVLCNECHSYFQKNKWQKFRNIHAVLTHALKDASKSKLVPGIIKYKDKELSEEELLSYKAGINRDIAIEVKHLGEMFDIPAKLETTLCPKCSKKGTKYFECVLQLRNANKDILEYSRRDIAAQAKKGVYLNKETRVDKYDEKDTDFYLTDQTYAKVLAEKLRKNFGGVIKKNAQLFSIDWETSKNLYRLNILCEFSKYTKNDVIKEGNHLYKVVSVQDTIHVVDLKTNKKTTLKHKEYDEVLRPAILQVIKKFPEYEVLDPQTYYQARLMNPSGEEINQKVKCIIDGGEAWIV